MISDLREYKKSATLNKRIAEAQHGASVPFTEEGGNAGPEHRIRRKHMAVTKEQIERINELSRKSRTPEGLTEEEKEERAELRAAYIAAFRESMEATLESTVIREPDGTEHRLQKKAPEENK